MNPNYQKHMRHGKGSPQREIHSITGLPKKDRNISNEQPNPTSTQNNKDSSEQVEGRK